LDASQKYPVPDQQWPPPHLQTPSFSKAPVLWAQTAAELQAFVEAGVQTSPVPGVQRDFPQVQLDASLARTPSW